MLYHTKIKYDDAIQFLVFCFDFLFFFFSSWAPSATWESLAARRTPCRLLVKKFIWHSSVLLKALQRHQ